MGSNVGDMVRPKHDRTAENRKEDFGPASTICFCFKPPSGQKLAIFTMKPLLTSTIADWFITA
jgi:hypothetical protein